MTDWILSVIVSAGTAAVAWRARALTPSGAAIATVVGTLILRFGGRPMALIIAAAVLTSSALTRWQAARKSHPEHRWGRSGAQVIANGAIATGLAVWYGIAPTPWISIAFAGAVAGLTADTWATEVGVLSTKPPRLITSGRPVESGRSGGITVLGTTAGIAGAVLISVIASLGLQTPLFPVLLGGGGAMLVDSLLGATVEGRYRGIDNNIINGLMTAVGAGLAVVLAS